METGTTTFYDGALLGRVTNGTVPETLLDQACLRILTTMFRLGVFDTAYTPSAIPVAEHDAVARQTEEQAITLLKNNNDTLPLSPATKSITVVGADANILAAPSGAPWVSPTKTTSVLGGILARAGSASVNWVPGNDPVNAASMLESSDMTTVPSSVLTPTNGVGTVCNAFYWHNTRFQGAPAITRVDKQVNYDVGFLSTFGSWAGQTSQVPVPPVDSPAEQQSVVYDGTITAPKTGDYTLDLTGFGDADPRARRRTDHHHDRRGRHQVQRRFAGAAPHRRPVPHPAHHLPGRPPVRQPRTRNAAAAMEDPVRHRFAGDQGRRCRGQEDPSRDRLRPYL